MCRVSHQHTSGGHPCGRRHGGTNLRVKTEDIWCNVPARVDCEPAEASVHVPCAGSLCAGLQDLVASTQADTLAAQASHGAATEAGAALVGTCLYL